MRKIAISLVFFGLLVAAETGCTSSETGANNSVPAAADSPAAPQNGGFADARTALNEGIRLLETGETDRAIDVLQAAVALDPDLAEAYFQLGIAYALVEKRDAAKVETEVTPTPDPKQKKPREYKTNSEKAFEKAVTAYKKMLVANPDDDSAHFNLGRAYNKLNEDEDAAKSLKQAVKLKPDDTEYETELGAILIKLAQYHEAIAPLKKAIELDADNIRAQELLDDAEAGRKRVDYAAPKKDEKKSDKGGVSNTKASDDEGVDSEAPANAKPQPKKTAKPAFPSNSVN
ncbi:MAG: tetratricopeptide repeat protein [Acidobacteriota bacterium]